MACSIHLRIRTDLLGIARVLRLLRRFSVRAADVELLRGFDGEFANVHGTLAHPRKAPALAAALAGTPSVTHAAILDERRVFAEFRR